MSKWAQAALTIGTLLVAGGIAWGVITTRMAAAEVQIDKQGTQIERHERELIQVRDEQKGAQWNLWALCRHVGAPDCRRPGER